MTNEAAIVWAAAIAAIGPIIVAVGAGIYTWRKDIRTEKREERIFTAQSQLELEKLKMTLSHEREKNEIDVKRQKLEMVFNLESQALELCYGEMNKEFFSNAIGFKKGRQTNTLAESNFTDLYMKYNTKIGEIRTEIDAICKTYFFHGESINNIHYGCSTSILKVVNLVCELVLSNEEDTGNNINQKIKDHLEFVVYENRLFEKMLSKEAKKLSDMAMKYSSEATPSQPAPNAASPTPESSPSQPG